MFTKSAISFGCLLAAFTLGCNAKQGAQSATKAPATGGLVVVVTDEVSGSKKTLSQKQAQWFVNDISGPGRRSKISEYPAAPIAKFAYGGKEYLMHGNAVINIKDDGTEFLWSGPYLQALIFSGTWIHESIDAVENLSNLKGVKMDAPGAYPGGGPAPLVEQK